MSNKTVQPEKLVAMDLFADEYALRVELAYARTDNLLLGEQIYHDNARLWLHEDLAAIVLLASEICRKAGYRIVLYDGLRTVEAQKKMTETERIRNNPQWLEEPRLISNPGQGAHPRGMAIDMGLETQDGLAVDMGTPFDFMAETSDAAYNPAHRDYKHAANILANRKILDDAMKKAAELLELDICPLPQEWWDFRFPREIYEAYAPLRDSDLPPYMRMVTAEQNELPDYSAWKNQLEERVRQAAKNL